MLTGMTVETGRVIRTELGVGMMTPLYQGSMHTQFNPDCVDADFVIAFASEDFSAIPIADQEGALATFGFDIEGCRSKCGL